MRLPQCVLIVDDDPTFRAIIRDILEDAGYNAVTLRRPAGIVAAVHAHQPDLIILDLYMPGELQGAEVLAVLDAAHIQVPILICTALVGHGASLAGHRLLLKPFDIADLLTAVRDLIGPPGGGGPCGTGARA